MPDHHFVMDVICIPQCLERDAGHLCPVREAEQPCTGKPLRFLQDLCVSTQVCSSMQLVT